jgi:competence protein ComGD
MNNAKSAIRAFTLLETLLVLAISSFVIIMFTVTVDNTIHIVRGELFVAQFEHSYKHTQFQAAATNQALTFSAANRILMVGEDAEIEVPEEAELNDFSVKFDAQGNNSSLKKITLKLPYERKSVTYQLEMGSGKYKKTIQ